jgi:hypothetical protein
MKYLPKSTLAYFQAAPQLKQHDLAEMPVSVFAEATKKYRSDCGEVFPNDEALNFYALNHLAAIVKKSFTPNETLPEWAQLIMATYLKTLTEQGKRMLHYILSITTREMRHLKTGTVTPAFWEQMELQYGKAMRAFIEKVCGLNEMQAVSFYMTHPPDCTIGQFIDAMSYGFHKGKWSSGYGGKKWGLVADAAKEMIHGKTSMELLVDVGYTLAHNGGPIFNKGMMYSSYEITSLTMILDVQRSGQIPDLILDTLKYPVKVPELAEQMVELVVKNRPTEFKGWVDWAVVKKMGAVGSYTAYDTQQKKKHPESTPIVEVKNLQGKKAKVPVESELFTFGKKFKAQVIGEWTVFPGEKVEIVKRVGIEI